MLYGPDLARVHAEGFAGQWDNAVGWLAQIARATSGPAFAVDIGCGDGRMLSALARHGVRGRGFDISESLVGIARARGVDATVADAATLVVPPASLVIALGEVLAYENATGEVGLENVARNVAVALARDGAFVFDVTGPDMPAVPNWRDGGDWVVGVRPSITGSRLQRQITTFVREGDVWRRSDEVHTLQLLHVERVDAVLHAHGLTASHLATVGGAALLPGRIAFLARRADGN